MSLVNYIYLSTVLFAIGAATVLVRRNAIVVFMGVELMLNATNLAFVTFARVHGTLDGQVIALFVMVVAAAEVVVGLAIIMAIFRARPSPFYVLDEVEAALDDRNLSRLLDALEGLRDSSQLIVITHQKRTMEIADALYGVTMRGDGVSTVVSQRLREREPV